MTRTAAATGPSAQPAERLRELNQRLGDPWAPGNPLNFPAVLAADERAEMFADGEAMLDDYRLNAEFVPVAHGGNLARLDDLVEIMRALYRRDPSLGLGYGFSSFISSVNIWTAADDTQQREAADLLLRGGKIAAAYHELAHGNDIGRASFAALPTQDGTLLLNGRKEVVTNIQRSDAMVLFARTDPRESSRSHSQILVVKDQLPAGHLSYLPRFATAGMRGVQLGGVDITDCPLPEDRVLGRPGQGLETMLRSFQITRTMLVAIATGILDSGLRATLRHVSRRELYGRPVASIPQVRSVLAETFADLYASEVFANTVARAAHLAPAENSIYTLAVKFHLAKTLISAMNRLSAILGAHFYIRDQLSGASIFQKLLRDTQPVGFGHIAPAVCQSSLLQQLPLLARRAWAVKKPAPAELFQLDAPLDPLDFQRLTVSSGGRERLSSSLAAGLDELGEHHRDHNRIRQLARVFANELTSLTEECAKLTIRDVSTGASAAALDLTRRYIKVLAAAAYFETWRHNQHSDDSFLRDPAWLTAALTRLTARPGALAVPLPHDTEQQLLAELTQRHATGQSFGLRRTQPLGG